MKNSPITIIANGDFLNRDLLSDIVEKTKIIALDGAADKLILLDITPDIILGDFDSITDHGKHYWQQRHIPFIHAPDQQYTDLVKAIHYCDEQAVLSISIVCATGGRLDHHESAMRALRYGYQKNRPMILHTEHQSIRYAKDETITIRGKIGDKCAILAFPGGEFSSEGLEYDVKNFPLVFGYSESACNSLAKAEAVIEIKGEALIMMPRERR